MSRDSDILRFLHQRLEHVHGESPNLDYMHNLSRIADSIEAPFVLEAELHGKSIELLAEQLRKAAASADGILTRLEAPAPEGVDVT